MHYTYTISACLDGRLFRLLLPLSLWHLSTTLSLLFNNFIPLVIGSATATAAAAVKALSGQGANNSRNKNKNSNNKVHRLARSVLLGIGQARIVAKSRREWKVKTTFTTIAGHVPSPLTTHPPSCLSCAACMSLSLATRCRPVVLSPTAPRRRVVCLPFPSRNFAINFYKTPPKSLLLFYCCCCCSFGYFVVAVACRDKMHLNKLFLDQCRVILLVASRNCGVFPHISPLYRCMCALQI